MSWGPNKLRPALVAATLVAASLSAASSAAAILVVRAVGPSAKIYPPGKSLPEKGKISLKANDSLVVLDGRGTRTLKGPGIFEPGGPATVTRSALPSLTGAATQRRARIGAVRSIGAVPRNPNIWQVDIARSSTVCINDPQSVQLWRADPSQPATLTVSRAGGESRTIEWAAGESTAPWPADLPISESGSYQLSWSGAAAPTALRFKTLKAGGGGIEETASALILNGCEAQLDVLIETFRVPEEGAATTG